MYTVSVTKRLFMLWLVICTVGYGTAWAFDGHIDEQAEHHSATTAHPAAGDDGDQPDCDHCCHATAHMTAFWPCPAVRQFPGADIGHTPYLQAVFFNATSPPEHPPRG